MPRKAAAPKLKPDPEISAARIVSSGRGGARINAGPKKRGTPEGEAYALLARAKTKREHYLAQMAELEYRKLAGETILAEDVARMWEERVYVAKGRFLALPSRLAPDLLHLGDLRAIEAKLREAILVVMDELANDSGEQQAT